VILCIGGLSCCDVVELGAWRGGGTSEEVMLVDG
jgi:hypothetical protein